MELGAEQLLRAALMQVALQSSARLPHPVVAAVLESKTVEQMIQMHQQQFVVVVAVQVGRTVGPE
jgi:hypothetical protein